MRPSTKITTTNHRQNKSNLNEKHPIDEMKAEKSPGEIPPTENDIKYPENVYLQRFKNGYRRRLNYE